MLAALWVYIGDALIFEHAGLCCRPKTALKLLEGPRAIGISWISAQALHRVNLPGRSQKP